MSGTKANSGSFKKGRQTWNKGLTSSTDYHQIHKWVRRNKGSADRCQNVSCKGDSTHFDWAKLPECPYEHKLENYIQLCRKCHKLMDHRKVKIEYVKI